MLCCVQWAHHFVVVCAVCVADGSVSVRLRVIDGFCIVVLMHCCAAVCARVLFDY